jgi:hypothetical protein
MGCINKATGQSEKFAEMQPDNVISSDVQKCRFALLLLAGYREL